jgi:hypothetical protein
MMYGCTDSTPNTHYRRSHARALYACNAGFAETCTSVHQPSPRLEAAPWW